MRENQDHRETGGPFLLGRSMRLEQWEIATLAVIAGYALALYLVMIT